jgi:hypothetical protein
MPGGTARNRFIAAYLLLVGSPVGMAHVGSSDLGNQFIKENVASILRQLWLIEEDRHVEITSIDRDSAGYVQCGSRVGRTGAGS